MDFVVIRMKTTETAGRLHVCRENCFMDMMALATLITLMLPISLILQRQASRKAVK